ncbi:N-lysine methyltransferase KMT5A-A [Aplysia californica]|uniref:N-lysine methyltransferase KMT5A-A n=1 Tax=Aplysia californica TaxID=6500 RepID=A0ABM1VV78_APLCA|nr:N-lysine methyltransferase KMT5A-A [Aplysia californica]
MSRLHRKPQLTRVEKLINGLTKGLSDKRFVVKEVAGKGRSVFLCVPFIRKDAFVLEYEGDYISEKEASQREKIYAANNEGSFILNFRFMGKKMAIDATRRFDSFSRLLNHSIRPNIRFHPPLVTDVVSGVPRIAAYALRDIHKGEELTMDYGIERGNMSWLHCEGSAHLSSIDLSSEMEPNDDTLPDCDMSFSVFQPLLSPRDSSSKCVSPSSFSSNNSFTPCMMEEQRSFLNNMLYEVL